ncbi:Pup--protein ligase [Bifidobacterium stellenboschense]|uniref:Pup--protein ligase n=1 Tax=Bifidobacterium stellenboschense TaxID=762211 RepID=A0A087DTC3_9BIFI|nr:Pup--protein ligase [Bifidobacterium stellenboschense]KFI98773.1 putative proteasome component [Bifidobacterium stellenboschense]
MPQLRDSGTRAAHEAGATPAAELDGFMRIFGVETEYGVSVTGADRPVDAGQVAMTMFQPVVSRARSTNTYLDNGSRLYLDVGSHPEYATAEARDPFDALAQDAAGERVMASLAADAQTRLRAGHGEDATIHVFKNNVDSAGHAFGCHENYLVRRFVPLETIERQLLPFLITRQLYTGAGRFTPDGFQITQRADFLDEAVSSATTRSRPMVNTRDEPHADPESFRRLHVIIGDSNRSQWATWMKLAVTHLVLCVIEDAVRRGRPSGFEDLTFDDPAAANRAVSRWLDAGERRVGDAGAAGMPDPLAMQHRYLDIVEAFVRDHHDAVAASLPKSEVDVVLADWRWALEMLERRDFLALSTRVDWAAKHVLASAMRRRRPDLDFAQLERMELDYHDVANGRLYGSLVAHSRLQVLLEDSTVAAAKHEPPADTRAALRGAFVRRALDTGAQFSCDWTTLVVTAPTRREATLLDPFGAEPSDAYRALMAAME